MPPTLAQTSTSVNLLGILIPMTPTTRPPPVIDLAACCTPVTREPMTAESAQQLARTLKAIADPTRLRLLSLVAAHDGGEACVCDLTEPVGLTQPTVSHHLKILVDAGLLTRDKRGIWAYYALLPGALNSVAALISG